jgi:hypothetical protein
MIYIKKKLYHATLDRGASLIFFGESMHINIFKIIFSNKDNRWHIYLDN